VAQAVGDVGIFVASDNLIDALRTSGRDLTLSLRLVVLSKVTVNSNV
jgi:hypothetical protein